MLINKLLKNVFVIFAQFDFTRIMHSDNQTLSINRKKKQVNISIQALQYTDKDTRNIIIYSPAIDVTGYGDTVREAQLMFDFSAKEFCRYLINLPEAEATRELMKYGWDQNKMFHKRYSASYVDIDGNLGNFNALDNKIEIKPLEFAA